MEHEERLKAALADRYAIESEIGSGGMATVYLALDLKHDRKVAIKVLKPELAAVVGTERFLAEIRTTANLTHPHILPLFDSGESDGFLFYVMPYVEGESLKERMDRERQLSVEDALHIASEVADALDHAHRQGVIHRDIKPANILLHEDRALVADFGIAIALNAAGGERLTETGLSLGTPSYMSPEQAAGEGAIDHRSDVYSLAAVTYEMLAGEPPHTGDSVQAVFAKVLTQRPEPIRSRRPRVPEWVEDALDRALDRVPADRHPSAGAFTHDLRTERAVSAPSRGTLWALLALTAVVTAAVTAGLGIWLSGDGGEELASVRTPPVERPLTLDGRATGVGLSPGGETVAYFTPEGLVTRDVAGGRETLVLPAGDPAFGLPGTTSALLKNDPQWHPSGTHLTYGASVGIDRFRVQTMPPRGGEVVPLMDFVPAEGEPAGGHQVFPDGERVLMVRILEPEDAKPWFLIGDRRTDSVSGLDIEDGAVRIWDATLSPDGEWIAYIAEREDQSTFLGTVAVDGSVHHLLLEAGQELSKWPETSSSPAWPGNRALKWVAPDRLYYRQHTGRGMDIWVQRVDPGSGEAVGNPHLVYPRLPRGAGFDISADARTLAYAGGFNRAQVHLYDLEQNGRGLEVRDSLVTSGTGWNVAPRIAPDGRRLAFLAMTLNGADLFVSDSAAEGFGRVNVPNGWTTAWAMEWAPDGQRVAMSVGTRTGPKLVMVNVESGSLEVIEGAMVGPPTRLLWARGGRSILIPSPDAGFWSLFDLGTGEERRFFESVGGEMVFVVLSPDGERVLGMDITDGSLWVTSLDSGELRRGATLGGGVARQPLWWDSEGTLVIHDVFAGLLWRMDWETGEEELWGELPAPCIHEGYTDISPDGRTLVCSVRELISDVWIVEDFDPEVVSGGRR